MVSGAALAPYSAAATDGHGTFCDYLARQLVAKLGFTAGTVPEAEELIAACDIVLTKGDGYPFTILCLIDREKNPAGTFDIPAVRRGDQREGRGAG